jgi:acetyl-CoA/propionyl-CoA carboxylase biotin carboxyl carrier protein
MPAPGPVTRLEIPQGPGVRWDSGRRDRRRGRRRLRLDARQADRHRRHREQALQRARRALDELVVEACRPVVPFHRAVVPGRGVHQRAVHVHTRWIETEWDNQVPPYSAAPAAAGEDEPRQTVVVEVGGRRLGGLAARGPGRPAVRRRAAASPASAGAGTAGRGLRATT